MASEHPSKTSPHQPQQPERIDLQINGETTTVDLLKGPGLLQQIDLQSLRVLSDELTASMYSPEKLRDQLTKSRQQMEGVAPLDEAALQTLFEEHKDRIAQTILDMAQQGSLAVASLNGRAIAIGGFEPKGKTTAGKTVYSFGRTVSHPDFRSPALARHIQQAMMRLYQESHDIREEPLVVGTLDSRIVRLLKRQGWQLLSADEDFESRFDEETASSWKDDNHAGWHFLLLDQ